ncbi:unnamed protein product [Amoebophrya sp. A120]|nr:unnamed protein product [Amoebophrya sp. A120]|eukprot:GSA120T00020424001.1
MISLKLRLLCSLALLQEGWAQPVPASRGSTSTSDGAVAFDADAEYRQSYWNFVEFFRNQNRDARARSLSRLRQPREERDVVSDYVRTRCRQELDRKDPDPPTSLVTSDVADLLSFIPVSAGPEQAAAEIASRVDFLMLMKPWRFVVGRDDSSVVIFRSQQSRLENEPVTDEDVCDPFYWTLDSHSRWYRRQPSRSSRQVWVLDAPERMKGKPFQVRLTHDPNMPDSELLEKHLGFFVDRAGDPRSPRAAEPLSRWQRLFLFEVILQSAVMGRTERVQGGPTTYSSTGSSVVATYKSDGTLVHKVRQVGRRVRGLAGLFSVAERGKKWRTNTNVDAFVMDFLTLSGYAFRQPRLYDLVPRERYWRDERDSHRVVIRPEQAATAITSYACARVPLLNLHLVTKKLFEDRTGIPSARVLGFLTG